MSIRTPGVDVSRPRRSAPEDDLDRRCARSACEEFVGQEALREQLGVSLPPRRRAARRSTTCCSPARPGSARRALAQIVADELDVPFVQTAGPALERKGDVAAFLTALEPRSVFFIDEIHRLPRAVEETFYPAMEDRQLPITVGQGAGARGRHAAAAAVHAGRRHDARGPAHHAAARPLRHPAPARPLRRPPTSPASSSARRRVLGVGVDAAGARAIAERARGTPRVANRLLKAGTTDRQLEAKEASVDV